MIIIVSILIIFFMCHRGDEPVYKVGEGGKGYEQEVMRQQMEQVMRQQQQGGVGGGGQVIGRKEKVKEWYV